MSKTEKTKSFKLIQNIGILGLDFKSTEGYTLEFEESKLIAQEVLSFIERNEIADLSDLKKEVNEAQLGTT